MSDLKNILINVGYDDINLPNLHNYNIEPGWNIQSKTNITTLLDNTLGNFRQNTIDNFIKTDSNFIYPIVLFDNKLFDNYTIIDFDERILKSIKLKKCKIVFAYLLEGYFNNNILDWINNLCQKYQFFKEDVIVITSNLFQFSNNKFTIINYDYFGNHINFLSVSKLDSIKVKSFENDYHKFINNNFVFHFLCFNGIPRENRLLMFNELTTNEKFKNKSITTLRGVDKNYYYDVPNWDNQKIGGGARLNIDAHLKCFLNIVTETLYDNESLFISEKTYKPIYLCQPFIVFGNPFTLNKLHELGYKTFDKWWDESYDSELDLKKRFDKIVNVLEQISDLDINQLMKLKNKMREILIHNYFNFFKLTGINELFKTLQCDLNKSSLI
jgi:hypothetical protein